MNFLEEPFHVDIINILNLESDFYKKIFLYLYILKWEISRNVLCFLEITGEARDVEKTKSLGSYNILIIFSKEQYFSILMFDLVKISSKLLINYLIIH